MDTRFCPCPVFLRGHNYTEMWPDRGSNPIGGGIVLVLPKQGIGKTWLRAVTCSGESKHDE